MNYIIFVENVNKEHFKSTSFSVNETSKSETNFMKKIKILVVMTTEATL
jgi:hypothetical protein